MLSFVVRRLIAAVEVLFYVALIVFILLNVVGGDPTYQMVGKHATAEQIAEVRRQYGLDQPQYVQFGQYLKQIVTFDYGRSYADKQLISEKLLAGVGPTLMLGIPAFLITTLLAIVIALLVAYYRGRWIDKTVVVFCVFGMSVPILAYILFGQYLNFKITEYYSALGLQWPLPISGYYSSSPFYEQVLALVVPVLIWVLVSLGYDVRFFRTAIVEETQQDYVRTARAKGLSERPIFFKHVLKNSSVPIITNIVIEIPLLLLGSLLLENFFGIPGLGSMIVNAFHDSDFPMIRAVATLTSVLVIFGNFITEVLYAVVDPRIKLK